MPRLRSHTQTQGPSSAASPDASPATPTPSPSTSLPLGLGRAADPSKPASMAPPRRSLRLAGAAAASPAPTTPLSSSPPACVAATGSSLVWKRTGKARVLGEIVAPKGVDLGGNGGGAEARISVGGSGGGGEGVYMSLRLGARTVKRRMEASGERKEEMELGLDGGADEKMQSIATEDEVHDEMPHQSADGSVKRRKSELVEGTELDFVSDSDIEEDSDQEKGLPDEDGGRTITLSLLARRTLEIDGDLMNMDWKDEERRYGSRENGKGEIEEDSGGRKDVLDDDGGVTIAPSLFASRTTEVDGVFVDMEFKEELRRYCSRKKGKGEGKLALEDEVVAAEARVGSGVGTRRPLFSPNEKGKGKMVVEESSLSVSMTEDELDADPVAAEEIESMSRIGGASVEQPMPEMANPMQEDRREAARKRAIALAPKFAFFKPAEDGHSEEDDAEELEPDADPEDWPGPFSTAMRIIDDRDAKLRARELNSSKLDKSADVGISWAPSKDRKTSFQPAPSLKNLCLRVLSNNAEGIESLEGIPDELKHKLVSMLCHSRKMNTHLLSELVHNSPTTMHLSDCSWLTEDEFEGIFGKCSTAGLQVLQLDLSGRCMPDYILTATLARVPNSLPSLTKISLKGNYRLSDNGLDAIVSSAPSLRSLNLCLCSLLTSTGIEGLANKLNSVLRELYIDDCMNVEAMLILPALKKIKHLEVLSMSGIPSVCDKFVRELIPVHGSNMKELAFAGCSRLTTSSIKIIGENCPQLSSLDIRNLNRLRDSAMRHLSNGCHSIQKLKLRRNIFSDEAIALFFEESGGCLTELNLNSVEKAGNLTARAISRKCTSHLQSLDLSFCRKMTKEAVGLIVDSCLSLRILKLFGCTQITDVFLNSHSNSLVKIIGMKGNMLDEMDSHEFL